MQFLHIACKKEGSKCNCDIADGNKAIDEGDLTETDHLPVKKIVNTNAQRGSSELGVGEFECFGDESKFFYRSLKGVLKFGFGRDLPPWKFESRPLQIPIFHQKVTHSYTNWANQVLAKSPNFSKVVLNLSQIWANFEI